MSRRLATAALVAAVTATLVAPLAAQDRFPAQVPRGPLTVGIRDFARLPDPSAGNVPRASVMLRDPLGRLVVNDQRGPVYTVSNNGATVTEYLDIRDYAGVSLFNGNGEVGFQSIAFHPDFAAAGSPGYGKLYTLHSSTNTAPTPDFDTGSTTSHHEVLLEWTTANPGGGTFTPANAAQPYREVMRLDHPFGNHNGGLISFNTSAGPGSADRTNLYIAQGDGGSSNDPLENGQNLGTPYGKILRINPTGTNSANGKYGIVAANAFASDPAAAGTLAEVYAYGLRNPQRFGWDDANGRMFAADIGQNAVEELNLIVNGGNYGWDQREGSFTFEGAVTGAIDPVAEYDHTNLAAGLAGVTGSRAITMGEVVRGSSIPGLNGKLLFGDFPSGLLFYLDADADPLDGGQDGIGELALQTANGTPVRLLDLINAERAARGLAAVTRADLRYSVGTDGEVYVLNKQDGVIRTLIPVPEPAALATVGGLALVARRRRGR